MTQNVGKHCMVRTQNAGVFCGTITEIESDHVVVSDARRIWYWAGAASLSQLATTGTSNPSACKFPATVASVTLKDWIEIIPTTEAARESIDEVKPWQE